MSLGNAVGSAAPAASSRAQPPCANEIVRHISHRSARTGSLLRPLFFPVCVHLRNGVRPFQEQPSSEAVEKMEKVGRGAAFRQVLYG